jgi:hypothetical protein
MQAAWGTIKAGRSGPHSRSDHAKHENPCRADTPAPCLETLCEGIAKDHLLPFAEQIQN